MTEDAGSRTVFTMLDRINAAFHELGPEPYANINRLTRLSGELLGADAAVYYRRQKDSLFAVGRWGLSDDFSAVVASASVCAPEDLSSEGMYIRQGAGHGGKPPCNVSCAKLGMKACAGRPVMSGDATIGLQCVLYKSDYVPHPLHARLMSLVTGALAVEEERLRMERARQKLSEELRQSQKMEAIGLLAGGVAHDFNNALTSIRGNAELISAHQDLPEAVRDESREIVKASEYAGALTRQLLTFSRKQVVDPQLLDLNAVVTNLAKILRRTLGENIAVELTLAEKLDCVRADAGQIEQVVMNLAVNARDAMPEGGKLVIRTAIAEMTAAALPLSLRERPGRYVVLSVSDTGSGMTEDVLQRLFEPFFTTKEQGKGTGLGLSTVYGIARQAGGDITVESAVGKGSTFSVLLPALPGVAAARSENEPLAGLTSAGEPILLVEDESSVRTMVARVLRSAGFTVHEARHGREALQILAQNRGIHLMVTDIVMPEMSGYQLAQEVRKTLPGLPVLFMSGYADESMLKAASASENSSILMKPFSPTELLRRIRALKPA